MKKLLLPLVLFFSMIQANAQKRDIHPQKIIPVLITEIIDRSKNKVHCKGTYEGNYYEIKWASRKAKRVIPGTILKIITIEGDSQCTWNRREIVLGGISKVGKLQQ